MQFPSSASFLAKCAAILLFALVAPGCFNPRVHEVLSQPVELRLVESGKTITLPAGTHIHRRLVKGVEYEVDVSGRAIGSDIVAERQSKGR